MKMQKSEIINWLSLLFTYKIILNTYLMSLSITPSIPPDQTTHWVRSLYFSSWVTQLQNMLWEKIKEVFSPLVWELMVTSRLASIANVGKKTLENISLTFSISEKEVQFLLLKKAMIFLLSAIHKKSI